MAVISIDRGLCTGCEVCVTGCPTDVLRMDETGQVAEIRYPDDCMVCEQCARDCPADAIVVTLEKTLPVTLSWQ